MTNLLMICTGNICRSPIAEGLAPIIGTELGLTIQTKSAGTLGLVNRPADPKSVKVCKEINIDISKHKSQPITQELVDWATYILVMERRHARHLRERYQGVDDKVMELGTFSGLSSIKDPIGGWTYKFRGCRKQIDKGLRKFIAQLPR
jgi:protein-tyrosine-phosphatase